jgi:hypothetical protein
MIITQQKQCRSPGKLCAPWNLAASTWLRGGGGVPHRRTHGRSQKPRRRCRRRGSDFPRRECKRTAPSPTPIRPPWAWPWTAPQAGLKTVQQCSWPIKLCCGLNLNRNGSTPTCAPKVRLVSQTFPFFSCHQAVVFLQQVSSYWTHPGHVSRCPTLVPLNSVSLEGLSLIAASCS